MLKGLILKIVGKRLDAKLEKWGVSKTKIIAVVGVLVYAVQTLGPIFGYPVVIPAGVLEVLASLGLWSLRDGMDPKPTEPPTPLP